MSEEEIIKLKMQHNAIILAHNYTLPEVQDIADFVGDSLELSRKAAECNAPVIVFCGVRFMAETAKILSPNSKVLLPNGQSGCPMADMADPQAILAYKKAHPDVVTVAYVNTTAETKTVVDICCTSGNAEKILCSIPLEQKILFLPDANLGKNMSNKIARKFDLWPGFCPTHNRIFPQHITEAKERYPNATVIVHPECTPSVVQLADQSLSTGGMLKYVASSPKKQFVIATEVGIIYRLQKENPDKEFISLAPTPVCPNMKRVTLENVLFCLQSLSPEIVLDDEVIKLARKPIDKMLEQY